MKHHILFVDDEIELLEGLKRMLRSMRHEWDMSFFVGAPEALKFLEHTSVDVVISDVRMPVMNGVQFLIEVKRLYPHTTRILLSGQSDEELTLSAVAPVHQYLSKPCEAAILKSTISRVCALHELLDVESIRELVSQVDVLPTLSESYLELEEELQSSECSMESVANIIAKDVSMTAQILKLVNSDFFGSQQHMSDATQAVMFLGMDTIKTLVLSIQVFQKLGATACAGFQLDRLSQHTLEIGTLARKIMIVEQADSQMVEEAFAGAILHDLGVLLLVSSFPESSAEVIKVVRDQNLPLCDAERQVLGTTHAEVGAYLLGLWGLTTPIVEAVAFHHAPLRSSMNDFSPLTAVYVANHIHSESTGALMGGEGLANIMCLEYLDQLGLRDRLPIWRNLFLEVPV